MNSKKLTLQSKKVKKAQNRSSFFIKQNKLAHLSSKLKKSNKKSVLCIGSFDLLNPGHCRFLAEAKTKGDVLIAGVCTDASIKRTKGNLQPLTNQEVRAELVSYIESVDYVTFVEEDFPHAAISLLKPDVLFITKGEFEGSLEDLSLLVKEYGGQIFFAPKVSPYFNTTKFIDFTARNKVLMVMETYMRNLGIDHGINLLDHIKPTEYGDQTPRIDDAFNAYNTIVDFEDLTKLGNDYRKKGKSIAFVAGSYDLLHAGHARFIQKASVLADVLVVGIPSDDSLRMLKGVDRPVISQNDRAYVLGSLDFVNHVVIFDTKTVLEPLQMLKPNVFFTVSESWNSGIKESAEYKAVVENGGKVFMAERQSPFLSSSVLINRLAKEKVIEIFKDCLDDNLYNQSILEKGEIFNE